MAAHGRTKFIEGAQAELTSGAEGGVMSRACWRGGAGAAETGLVAAREHRGLGRGAPAAKGSKGKEGVVYRTRNSGCRGLMVTGGGR